MTTKRRQSPILSSSYHVMTPRSTGGGLSRTYPAHTQKREAIRAARRWLRAGIRRVEVRTVEGGLIYQAHVNKQGRVVSEEL